MCPRRKQAIERLDATPEAHGRTYATALELLERLSILRLVHRALDSVEDVLPNNPQLSAARHQLRRSLAGINSLNNRAEQLSGLLSRCKRTSATGPEAAQPTSQPAEVTAAACTRKLRRLS